MPDRGGSGLFIVLEGGEGVGKTTQVALLSAWLGALGVRHVTAREPGGTPVGEAIRELVLGRTDLDMPAESELLLILAARAAFVRDVVRPALESGAVVVADRFSLSTLAYQGYGRGLALERVKDGIEIATGGLEPDLVLLLDLDVEEGHERQRKAGLAPDRIEQEGDSFRVRVRKGYLELADSEASVEVVGARGAPEEVHARIRTRLAERFPHLFSTPHGTDRAPGY
jgi:dTMP kinase